MQIALGSIPIHLIAREKNVRTVLRINAYEPDTVPRHKGHQLAVYQDYQLQGLASFPIDDIPKTRNFGSHVNDTKATTSSARITVRRTDGTLYSSEQNPLHLAIYTDSSKIISQDTAGTGCGYVFFLGDSPLTAVGQEPFHKASKTICNTMTVFQAEILAILWAITDYITMYKQNTIPKVNTVTIYSDSQSTIQALSLSYAYSKLVLECIKLLNGASVLAPITLRWVRAHVGTYGNEIADQLAQQGSLDLRVQGPHPFGPISSTFIHGVLLDEWNEAWVANPACRQTKLWFPAFNCVEARQLLSLTTPELGETLRWITGLNFTRQHQHLLDPATFRTNIRRLCHQEPESPEHLIKDCVTLDPLRRRFLETTKLTKPYKKLFAPSWRK